MNLLKVYSEWNELTFWNQTGVAVGFISLILTIAALGGMQMQLINLALVVLFFGYFCLVYGNIQQSRKLVQAENNLSKVDSRINQAVQAVYTHKGEEINELKTEIATWRDRAVNCQDQAAVREQELHQKEADVTRLNNSIDEQTTKINEQKQAYIRLRHAYKKAAGITTREVSLDVSVSSVDEGSTEHLQQLEQFDLYMEAERLARNAGIPEDA